MDSKIADNRMAREATATVASIRTRVGHIEKACADWTADSIYSIERATGALRVAATDLENALCNNEAIAAAMSRPAPTPAEFTLGKRPVAFRVQDKSGNWEIYTDEDIAQNIADLRGLVYQALYVRDGTPLIDPPAAEVTGERARLNAIEDIVAQDSAKGTKDPRDHRCFGACIKPDIIKALATPSPDAGRVPEGWKLVPIEPTAEMILAIFCFPLGERRFCGSTAREDEVVNTDTSISIYRAMLAASPAHDEVK